MHSQRGRDCAAVRVNRPARRCRLAALASSAIVLLVSASVVEAQNAGSSDTLKLPDVTVEQAPAKPTLKVVQTPKAPSKAKVAVKKSAPPATQPKPPAK